MSTERITTPITAELLRGWIDLERTARGLLPHRLPAAARRQIPDLQLEVAQSQPSGVRLAFRTRATTIELDTLPTKRRYQGMPTPPDGIYDLLVDGTLTAQATVPDGNVYTIIDMYTQAAELIEGPVGTARFTGLPDRDKQVEIWLPHNEVTELVALRTDASIHPSVSDAPVWLHHGSSISQGSNATHPSAIWPVRVSTTAGVDLVNLGFGGGALLDPFTARAMRDTAADLISLKLGINIVNADTMRRRAFAPAVHGFLDLIRDGHPTTPLLVISPILCPTHEHTPGPLAPDFDGKTLKFKATGDPADVSAGRLTLTVIREELARIVAERSADDPNLHYLDGRNLYGADDYAELPLPDEVHPDESAHRRIAERFVNRVFAGAGPFAAPRRSQSTDWSDRSASYPR